MSERVRTEIETSTAGQAPHWAFLASCTIGEQRGVALLLNWTHWAFGFEFGPPSFFSILIGPIALLTIRVDAE